MGAAFRILEHPADLGIEAEGESMAEAFRAAGLGLMSVIVESGGVEEAESRTVELAAGDAGQLLVRWLTEILYLFDGQRFVSCAFDIREISPTGLRATLRGEKLDLSKHRPGIDVKAVTYHQLLVQETAGGVLVRVFLDL